MNQESQENTSGLYKSISLLGQVIAVAAVILGMPLVFGMTKVPLYLYLAGSWGRDIAGILVWVMGAIEAYLIYVSVSLLVTAGIVWFTTTLAMRQFRK